MSNRFYLLGAGALGAISCCAGLALTDSYRVLTDEEKSAIHGGDDCQQCLTQDWCPTSHCQNYCDGTGGCRASYFRQFGEWCSYCMPSGTDGSTVCVETSWSTCGTRKWCQCEDGLCTEGAPLYWCSFGPGCGTP